MASSQTPLRASSSTNAYAAAELLPVRTQMILLVAILGVLVVGYFLASLLFYFHFLRPAALRPMADRVRKRASLASTLVPDAELLEDGDLEKLPYFTDERL